MPNNQNKPTWSLPYETVWSDDPRRRRTQRVARIVVYILILAALLAPAIQLEVKIIRNQRKAAQYQRKLAAGTLSAKERLKGPPKPHKGAMGRWSPAVRGLWAGKNIYESVEQYTKRTQKAGRPDPPDELAILHPNMPFTVILLTPFAFLPAWACGGLFTLCKVLAVAAAGLAAVRVCNHKNLRMPDWVVALGAAWWATLMISDIQHGNTNGFVLAAIVLHLWLYRRGRDLASGAALALAICIKMTPALFVLYWLYQRNWKLLAGCVVAGVIFAVIIPAALLGPGHYTDLTQTWMDNLIFKGLGGSWYPIHVNQSLPSVLGRYLLGNQPGGNIQWNPDDNPYSLQTKFQWIAFASLSPQTVRWIIKALQVAIVAVMAWAIGWRKLPRDDGRRGLHYAMVICAILLLNQRTWAHHAATILPATMAVWYAIAFGRFGSRTRAAVLAIVIFAGVVLWGTMGDLTVFYGRVAGMEKRQAKDFANQLLAYGPDFYYFLLIFGAAAILALKMKKSDSPYATERQKLGQ